MTMQSINSFMSSLSGNQTLAGGLYAAVGDLTGPAAERAVADFASANGFEVGISDVAKMRSECMAAIAGDRDLSDEELDGVDGGVVAEGVIIGAAIIGGSAALAAAGIGVAGVVGAASFGGGAAIVGALIGAGDNPVGNWFRQW